MMLRAVESSTSDGPIALLVNVLSSGGAQRRIATLANRFAELGRAVDFISFDDDGPMRAMLSPSIGVVSLVQSGALSLLNYIDRRRPVVLMSCVTDTHAAAVAACSTSDIRPFLVLRASRHPYRAIPRWNLIQRTLEPIRRSKAAHLYAKADAIVALSNDSAQHLRRFVQHRDVRVETINNPVIERTWLDDPDFQHSNKIADVPLLLGVGRLVRQKDFATLVPVRAPAEMARSIFVSSTIGRIRGGWRKAPCRSCLRERRNGI